MQTFRNYVENKYELDYKEAVYQDSDQEIQQWKEEMAVAFHDIADMLDMKRPSSLMNKVFQVEYNKSLIRLGSLSKLVEDIERNIMVSNPTINFWLNMFAKIAIESIKNEPYSPKESIEILLNKFILEAKEALN